MMMPDAGWGVAAATFIPYAGRAGTRNTGLSPSPAAA